ncbi:hypothetical protein VTL71DRAFT_5214 [Oculimacula yallundae]|uniref:Uncharacterized protein n=1 Tax=Oculimacula yallundae TaxID=86028 RepID=A0ABR4C231_9HELO
MAPQINLQVTLSFPRIIRQRSNATINGNAEYAMDQYFAREEHSEITRLLSRFNSIYPRPLRYDRPLRKARMRLLSSRLPTIYDDEVLQI